jgi:hypothetical protein
MKAVCQCILLPFNRSFFRALPVRLVQPPQQLQLAPDRLVPLDLVPALLAG